MKALPTLQDVVDQHLCSGCGACAFANPQQIRMQDTLEQGKRPVCMGPKGLRDFAAQDVCPGIGADPTDNAESSDAIPELKGAWGNVLEIWEGHAVDEHIRRTGSSGGVTTALALFSLEQLQMQGVVHVRARQDAPLLNETVFSRDRKSLLSGSGSRYAPASPCDGLGEIANADRPCVYIGKPCDVAAAAKARKQNVALDRNLGISLAIFCAGTPSIQGTLQLAKHLGVTKPEQITGVRYRGNGWPGKMSVRFRDDSGASHSREIDYADGWGDILQRHRQWRCHICADHTGEHADISIGDPWYRPIAKSELGSSLLLVRTETGRQLIRQAMAAGYVELRRKESWVLDAAQPHLRHSQASVWGRTLAMRLRGVGQISQGSRRRFFQWLTALNPKQKLQSILGTLRRISRKRLDRAEQSTPFTAPTVESPASSRRPKQPEAVV